MLIVKDDMVITLTNLDLWVDSFVKSNSLFSADLNYLYY